MADENENQNLRKLSEASKPHETLSKSTQVVARPLDIDKLTSGINALRDVTQGLDINKLMPNINALRDATQGLDINKLMPNIAASQHFTPRALPSTGGSRTTIPGEDRLPIKSSTDLGHLIRQARITKKLSQQQFADLAGVGRRFVSEAENGKATLEFGKVLQLAEAAGIDLFAKQR